MSDLLRHAEPGDIPALADLANRVFRSARNGDMSREFPLLFRAANAPNICLVERDGRIASMVGAVRSTWSIDGVDLPVAAIGSVCTDPQLQGEGLATRAIALAIADAIERGDVLMPISGDRSLYSRHDACLVGPCWQFMVHRERLGEPAGRPARPADSDAIVALHEQLPVRYRWSRPQFDELQQATLSFGGVAWVHEDAAGRIDGWALVFAGGPLYTPTRGEVRLVDSVGPPRAVAAVCAGILNSTGSVRVRFRVPWHDKATIDYFQPLAEQSIVAFPRGVTVRLLNLPKLLSLLSNRFGPLIEATGLTVLADGSVRLTVGGQAILLDTPPAVHHLLFTRSGSWPGGVYLPHSLIPAISPYLPIPLPDYGLCYV